MREALTLHQGPDTEKAFLVYIVSASTKQYKFVRISFKLLAREFAKDSSKQSIVKWKLIVQYPLHLICP